MEKMLYLLLVFLAIIFTADFLSLTQLILQKSDSLDNFNEISESGIPIYAMSQVVIQQFLLKRSENKALINSRVALKLILDISDCIDLILDTQNAICITFDFRGKYYVNENLDSDGKSLMKIVDGDMYGDYIAAPYEDNSPFIEKFDETMIRIMQSGLEKHLNYLETKPKIVEMKIDQYRDLYLKYRILIVFIVGCTLSLLSFCFEVLLPKY